MSGAGPDRPPRRDEFLSEEDLDLRHLSDEEFWAYVDLWLHQAQATNEDDEALYSHGVFERDPTAPHPPFSRRRHS